MSPAEILTQMVKLTLGDRAASVRLPDGFKVVPSVIVNGHHFDFLVSGKGFSAPVSISMLSAYAAPDDAALLKLVQATIDQAVIKIRRAQRGPRP